MPMLYLLQHSYELDGEEETKIIGIYSTEEKANQAIERVRKLPGFCEQPEAFYIDKYEVDKDNWTEGYITLYS